MYFTLHLFTQPCEALTHLQQYILLGALICSVFGRYGMFGFCCMLWCRGAFFVLEFFYVLFGAIMEDNCSILTQVFNIK